MSLPEGYIEFQWGVSQVPKYLYSSDSLQRLQYEGVAGSTALTSQAVWTVTKYVYNADNTLASASTLINISWDGRFTAVFP